MRISLTSERDWGSAMIQFRTQRMWKCGATLDLDGITKIDFYNSGLLFIYQRPSLVGDDDQNITFEMFYEGGIKQSGLKKLKRAILT